MLIVCTVYDYYKIDIDCKVNNQVEGTEYHHMNESAVVHIPNTVIDPPAMVVEIFNASFTNFAMFCVFADRAFTVCTVVFQIRWIVFLT